MILQRYIYKEISYKLLPICGLLLLIFISKYYVSYLADAASGKISTDLVITFLRLKIVASLPKMIPICTLIAVTLAFSRLVRDNELVIFHSAGVGRSFELLTTFKFSLVLAALFAVLVLFLSPNAEHKITQLKQKAKQDSDITGITAGRFKEFSKGDRIVYVESLSADRKNMSNVFLQVREQTELGVLSSDSACFEWDEDFGNRYIVFSDGTRYIGNPGQADYQITEYETYAVLVEVSQPSEQADGGSKTMNIQKLLATDGAAYTAEIQWRVSLILSCVLLSMLAVVLNSLSWNDKQYTLIFIGMMIYFIYSNLLGISKTMVSREQLSPFIGLWWVHLLLIAVIVALYYLSRHNRRSPPQPKQQVLPA